GRRARAAVEAPPAEVLDAVTQLASQQSYTAQAWLRHAARIARDFTPDRAADFLAAMVHPPDIPAANLLGKAQRPWVWVCRYQVAAALIVSQLESEGVGSRRREALLSLLWGPMDWTTDAALAALAVVAQDEEQAAADVLAVLREVLATLPGGGAVCYYAPLLWAMLRLPGVSGEER